jgi:hypothetical protein
MRPLEPKHIAAKYGVSRETFRRWLKPHAAVIGKRVGNKYNSLQMQQIVYIFGEFEFPNAMAKPDPKRKKKKK